MYKKIKIKNNLLLLQGPVGPFFHYFAKFCKNNAVNVYKIHFHYGESIFYKYDSVIYKDNVENWLKYFVNFIKTYKIKQIALIGAHKIYHEIAIKYCQENNIDILVFEEGYIRPDFITIEENGVNGDSSIPHDPNIYKIWNNVNFHTPQQTTTLNLFAKLYNKFSFFYRYSWGLFITQWRIPSYQHHIKAKGIGIFWKWNKFFISSICHTLFPVEKEKNTNWLYQNQNNYYIAILQINTDSAITKYSKYSSMEEFIVQTMTSFAKYAKQNTKLLIKHHPYDRGIHCYKAFIKKLTKELKLNGRVKYLIDLHIDLALELSLGCILINSTTGYSSIQRGIKTIALSKNAVFNVRGLTYQDTLDTFWNSNEIPDLDLFDKFKNYVIYNTQIRGCFYGGSVCDFHKKFIFDKTLNF